MSKRSIINELIMAYSEAYQNLGYSSLMGKIVALLISAPEPLSLDEISEQLQMSKGPISQISRKLKDHRLIEKVWIPGERKDYYRASSDIFGQAFANYRTSMRRNKAIAERFLQELDALDAHDDQTRHLLERMQEMKTFYSLMDEHNASFLEAWREYERSQLNLPAGKG